jgi:hypothetical protein
MRDERVTVEAGGRLAPKEATKDADLQAFSTGGARFEPATSGRDRPVMVLPA